ncbi:MAG: 50S ribosomal protein L10 [Firmicutes bacterium]|nr:50S ribosomal protein L10 [Bacillota bacterium]
MGEIRAKKDGKNFTEKQAVVAEIQKNLANAKSAIFIDYRGITVAEVNALRAKFRESGVNYKIYKNNLVRIALNNHGVTELDDQLTGTLAVAFSNNDEISAAKIVLGEKFKDKMEFKFGLLGTAVIDQAGVRALATMPTKEELIAQLMSLLQSGARGIASVVQAVPRNMAMVINQAKCA